MKMTLSPAWGAAVLATIFLVNLAGCSALLPRAGNDVVRKYKEAKTRIAAEIDPLSQQKRMATFLAMDALPRIVWGNTQRTLIGGKGGSIGKTPLTLNIYDLDGDKIGDQFVLLDKEGKELPQDFGFAYDLNSDRVLDYIVYYGGTAISNNNEFYLYFYHWIDANQDGRIDSYANNIFIEAGSDRPDPDLVQWIVDRDGNGRPDTVDVVDGRTGNVSIQQPAEDIWTYRDLFAERRVDASDGTFFNFFNGILTILNEP